MYYFDPRTSGFYLHKVDGAVVLSNEAYWVLISGQSEGRVIVIGNDGQPVLKVPEKTHEELLAEASASANTLLAVATTRIAPLQDAEDLGDASLLEIALLKQWKQYRVDVNRASDQTGYPMNVDWPAPPA